jgi:hypothetical protein
VPPEPPPDPPLCWEVLEPPEPEEPPDPPLGLPVPPPPQPQVKSTPARITPRVPILRTSTSHRCDAPSCALRPRTPITHVLLLAMTACHGFGPPPAGLAVRVVQPRVVASRPRRVGHAVNGCRGRMMVSIPDCRRSPRVWSSLTGSRRFGRASRCALFRQGAEQRSFEERTSAIPWCSRDGPTGRGRTLFAGADFSHTAERP